MPTYKRTAEKKMSFTDKAFCISLALENWDGALMLIKLKSARDDILTMNEAINILAKTQPDVIARIDAVFPKFDEVDTPRSEKEK